MTHAAGDPVDPGDLRVSDAEREEVTAMLARAMVAGRITASEYSDRAAVAQAARVRRELVGLLADLPGAVRHAAVAADVLDLTAGVGGSIRRHGHWRVPPTVRVRSWVGGVSLDFTAAECATPVVVVELATGLCSPVLVVTEEATVDVDDLHISAGSVRDETARSGGRGTPHLSVRGTHSFGDVVLRHPKRRRRDRWVMRSRDTPSEPVPGGTPPGRSRRRRPGSR